MAEVTVELLRAKAAEMRQVEQKMLAEANAAHGAAQMCEAMIAHMEAEEETLTEEDLARMGIEVLGEPEPLEKENG